MPFLKFSFANEPFKGLFSPSDHCLMSSAMLSGGSQVDLSASGIDSLF